MTDKTKPNIEEMSRRIGKRENFELMYSRLLNRINKNTWRTLFVFNNHGRAVSYVMLYIDKGASIKTLAYNIPAIRGATFDYIANKKGDTMFSRSYYADTVDEAIRPVYTNFVLMIHGIRIPCRIVLSDNQEYMVSAFGNRVRGLFYMDDEVVVKSANGIFMYANKTLKPNEDSEIFVVGSAPLEKHEIYAYAQEKEHNFVL